MQDIIYGFVNAVAPVNLLAALLSVAAGIVVGGLPGLSAAMGVALLIPMTFTMPAETGLIALAGVYCGAIFGGSISAILIHTPGTPAAAATAIDGYQMTLKGKAGKALGTAATSSFGGAMISVIALYFFSSLLAKLALKFGPAEYFWLSIFGLTTIAGVSTKSLVKGLLSGAIGLAVGHEFYFGAVAATCAVMFSLAPLSFFSSRVVRSTTRLLVEAENRRGLINEITRHYVAYEIDIHDIRFKHIEQEDASNLLITIVSDEICTEDIQSVVKEIESIPSVQQSKVII